MVLEGTISGSTQDLSNQGSLKNHFLRVLQRTYKGASKNLKKIVLSGTISGSTKNLSNQDSLKNHFLKEFFKEPIMVPQMKEWFFSR